MTVPPIQPLPGMSDLAEPEIRLWQDIEDTARRVFECHLLTEIRTPILEPTELFVRSLGEGTDVVQKEMFSFEDRGGRQVSLRPEGTAGVIRYLAARGEEALGARCYYCGPMFRAERAQAGRRRQFHQVGVELLGAPDPLQDAEALGLQHHLLQAWGLRNARIEINTRGQIGEQKAVAEGYRQLLTNQIERLCEDCRRRVQTNVLRVLDCKQEGCQRVVSELPAVTDFLGESSRSYFAELQRLVKRLELPVTVQPRLIRGLDYYVHTIWEVRHPALGAQDALAGGGRYQIEVGGKLIEGVGFAAGLERVITAVRAEQPQRESSLRKKPLAWVVWQGAPAREENWLLVQTLRRHGITAGFCLDDRSVKAQMRLADRSGARYAIIRGDLELAKGVLLLRDLQSGLQEELALPEVLERLMAAAREKGTCGS